MRGLSNADLALAEIRARTRQHLQAAEPPSSESHVALPFECFEVVTNRGGRSEAQLGLQLAVGRWKIAAQRANPQHSKHAKLGWGKRAQGGATVPLI